MWFRGARVAPALVCTLLLRTCVAEDNEHRLERAHSAARSLRGEHPTVYPPIDPSGRSPLRLCSGLDLGGAVVVPPPVRPFEASSSGDIEADMEGFVRSLQDEICGALEAVEARALTAEGGGGSGRGAAHESGATFREDSWVRAEGGGGRSRVIQGGRVFEKAGVNVSTVHGSLPPAAVAQMRSRPGKAAAALAASPTPPPPSPSAPPAAPKRLPFFACGISLVLHPHCPMAPSVHANFRLFRVLVDGQWVWWYGGGADLSPSYVFPEDAQYFHGVLKASCDRVHPTAYARFKAWADAYFSLPHRGTERRGVGGIFFDDLDVQSLATVSAAGLGLEGGVAGAADHQPHALLPFVADAGRSFLHAYLPILLARAAMPSTEAQREWQQLRRGRYVEFNLVHDRGTKFGLATPGARIESILMSLPLTARWEYCREPTPGSPEAALEDILSAPVDWCAETAQEPPALKRAEEREAGGLSSPHP